MNDRFKFRAWDKTENTYIEDAQFTYDDGCEGGTGSFRHYSFRDLLEDKNCIPEQCTGLKDKNGKLIYEGDIITYYHNKKKLVPVTDRKPFEAPYGNDEETGLPLQYRTVKIIKYKGYVSIDAIGGVELNLRHNLHWWKSLEKDVLTQVEVIGNIHENADLLDVGGK